MAVTENTMTGAGDGSTNSFSFTFPYLKTTDLKVELVRTTIADGTTTKTILDSTKFTFPTATSVALSSFTDTDTDGNGVLRNTWQAYDTGIIKANGGGYTYSGKVYRSTASDALAATFYPGSAIRSADLNDNYTQNLYVTQEANNNVTTATTDAATALTKATAAEKDATDALDNSQDLSADPSSAIDIAQAAQTAATNAENTANAAYSDVQIALEYKIVADKAALMLLNLADDDDGDFYEVTDADNMDSATGGTITWVDNEGATGATAEPNPSTMSTVDWDDKITVKVRWRGDTGQEKWEYVSYWNNDPESNYVRSASPNLTGSVTLKNNADLRLTETTANGSAYVGLKGPEDMGATTSYTLILPDTSPSTDKILKTHSSTANQLTWADDVALTSIDEDDMASDSTTAVPTQQSVKAYVDNQVATKQDADADTAKLDVDQTWTGAQRGTITTLESAASITIDFSTSNNFKLTTGHETIAFAEPTTEIEGQSGSIFITQGSTTCAVPSWHEQFIFAAGAAPSLTATEHAIARIDYIVQEAGKIHCVATDNLIAIPS